MEFAYYIDLIKFSDYDEIINKYRLYGRRAGRLMKVDFDQITGIPKECKEI